MLQHYDIQTYLFKIYERETINSMQPLARLLSIETSIATCRCLNRVLDRQPGRHVRPVLRANRWLEPFRGINRAQCSTAAAQSASREEGPVVPELNTSTSAIGQVVAAQANFLRVRVEEGDGVDKKPPQTQLLCVVRALLKKIKQTVLVGDRVKVIGIDWVDGRGMVEEVLPRRSQLAEPPVANVNHVVLVFAMSKPVLQPGPATRYLVTAEASELPVTMVLNKADLVSEAEREEMLHSVRSWGYNAISVSTLDGRGLSELEEVMKGRVTVIAGPSGAGKSSIINALRLRHAGLDDVSHFYKGDVLLPHPTGSSQTTLNVDLQAVGSVSERIGRGKHTTRNVVLLELGQGGLVADTPGFNQPSVKIRPAQLGDYFPEIRAAKEANPCAFSDCQHLEEPGCGVRGPWDRYEIYKDLHKELQILEEEEATRAISKRQREGNVRLKTRAGGKAVVEARLESKSHRRESRRSVKQRLSELAKEGGTEDDDVL